MNYYEQILINNQTKITNYLIGKCANLELAKDLYQDLFIKVKITLETGLKFDSDKGFYYWCLRIAHNLLVDHQRKQNRSKEVEMKAWMNNKGEAINIFHFKPDPALNPEQKIIHEELCSEVWSKFLKLKESQKQIMIQRLFQGMSYNEIAAESTLSINTLLGQMRYAKKNLRKLVKL